MTITAKYASRCATCGQTITPGARIEWAKGSPVRHTSCEATSAAPTTRQTARNWDPTVFRGYGRPRGGYRRACVTGGNCSSCGTGRSCGGHDCDGY